MLLLAYTQTVSGPKLLAQDLPDAGDAFINGLSRPAVATRAESVGSGRMCSAIGWRRISDSRLRPVLREFADRQGHSEQPSLRERHAAPFDVASLLVSFHAFRNRDHA
jgi:hypothetical protein